MSIDFGRLITAMITPFDSDGAVHIDEAKKIAEYLVDNGTDTVLLSGTTGESPTLTHDEEYELYGEVSRYIKSRAKVMVGTGSNCTRTAIASTQEAERIGADGSLQVVPYYNKPSQEGLYQHFRSIAENTSLPILLYNIPGRTSVNMAPETVARLASISNIVGIKEAAGSVEQVKAINSLVPKDFLIYSGDDMLTLDFMKAGAHGVVSVASHVAGKEMLAMIKSAVEENWADAEAHHERMKDLFEVLFVTTNPVPVKAAMRMLGFAVGTPRLPLIELTEDERVQVETVLDRYLDT